MLRSNQVTDTFRRQPLSHGVKIVPDRREVICVLRTGCFFSHPWVKSGGGGGGEWIDVIIFRSIGGMID